MIGRRRLFALAGGAATALALPTPAATAPAAAMSEFRPDLTIRDAYALPEPESPMFFRGWVPCSCTSVALPHTRPETDAEFRTRIIAQLRDKAR